MPYDVRIETFGGAPLAVVRRRASRAELSRVVPEACGAVWSALRAANATGMGRNVAVYLDCEINLEVGVEMDRPFIADGANEVVASALPGGTVATTTHIGPYAKLGDAHDAVMASVRANGYLLAGPSWEIYGHWQDEWNRDTSKIRTDVYYLIAPVR